MLLESDSAAMSLFRTNEQTMPRGGQADIMPTGFKVIFERPDKPL